MTTKEYLGQAYYIDREINSKIEIIDKLNALAMKTSPTMSEMPGSPTRNVHKKEDVIVKIMDLENEITERIDYLVDLKREIYRIINSVKNPDYRMLLELRYLCFRKWEEIAVEMNLEISWVHKLHNRALASVDFR